MMLKGLFAGALAAASFAMSAAAQTGAPEPPPAQQSAVTMIATCPQQDLSREAADQRVLDDITRAGQRSNGYDAIARRRADLEAMLMRAPACYPQIERVGANIIVRSFDPQGSMALSLMVGALAHAEDTNAQVNVVAAQNTYPYAAVMLGSYLNETHAYDEAITWLDRGLALQPHDQYLITEKVAALGQLRRQQEAVDLLQALLADDTQTLVIDSARVHRILGITLIDLNRLDEAEAALRESIRLQPQNPNAQHELEYIASLRAGAAATNAQLGPSPPSPDK